VAVDPPVAASISCQLSCGFSSSCPSLVRSTHSLLIRHGLAWRPSSAAWCLRMLRYRVRRITPDAPSPERLEIADITFWSHHMCRPWISAGVSLACGNAPMYISLPRLCPIAYASRISLYVMPPATNSMTLCFPSVFIARAEGALCQVGRADRSDPDDPGAGLLRPGAAGLPGAKRPPERIEAGLDADEEDSGASFV
jgi:hypothetical protein